MIIHTREEVISTLVSLNFSREGANALVECFSVYILPEEVANTYSEYPSFEALAVEYFPDPEDRLINLSEYFHNNTSVIEFDGGIIVKTV